MARRRYQKGSIKYVGGKFIGRWREDVILVSGSTKRINRKKILGTKEDFKTKREAQRALDLYLAPINSVRYRPTHQITFGEFAARWFEKVHSVRYKIGGSQATTARQVRNKLLPAFGSVELKDISTEMLQGYVASLRAQGIGAKTVRNIVSVMSSMWQVALNWKYVVDDPLKGLILPEIDKPNVQPYTPDEAAAIFAAATGAFKLFVWIIGETGMRPGEVCGLDASHIHLNDLVVSVRQAESLGHIVRPKTQAGFREFAISPQLAEQLRSFLANKQEGLLFVSKNGRPWREPKAVEKRLNPLLKKLSIERKGLKGFRHFNATLMDAANVPVMTRQTRLGHDDPRMTLGTRRNGGYTHSVGEDDRRAAALLGSTFSRVLCPDASLQQGANAVGMAGSE